MGADSKIEWTDHTFNPWVGCSKVSPGCNNCYAEELMDHRYHKAEWGPQGTRTVTSASNWRLPIKWNKQAEKEGVRRRVFCASLADVFEDRPELEAPRQRLFDLIQKTPYLDWLLLTKRPQNIRMQVLDIGTFENVWLGVSVEDQKRADERIPLLLKVPAKVRFLSCEPLLGPVNLRPWLQTHDDRCDPARVCSGCNESRGELHWVIVGGESGANARPMRADWARSLRDQCRGERVSFFFKQWGEWVPSSMCPPCPDTGTYAFMADKTVMVRVGKKNAGRLLDGEEWSQWPT